MLEWPFFEERHREFAAFAAAHLPDAVEDGPGRALPRRSCAALARDGWLEHAVGEPLDVRTLCLARETLACHDALADFAFAMQGLGSRADLAVRRRRRSARATCRRCAAGEKIAAFALSEPDAGSDVAAMTTTAPRRAAHRHEDLDLQRRDRGLLHGVRARAARASARTSSRPSEVEVVERIDVIAPHPLATLRFDDAPGAAARPRRARGCKIALGDARRLPLDGRRGRAGLRAPRAGRGARAREASASCSARRWPSCRWSRPSSPTWRWAIDASALLVYRAAWTKDATARARHPRGGDGQAARDRDRAAGDRRRRPALRRRSACTSGHPVERLYREIRALRIYEGASEVQQLIIAREVLR